MSQDLDLTLSRRAVAAGWKWQAGCRTDDDGVPFRWAHAMTVYSGFGTPEWCRRNWEDARPDFNDPATRGCLLDQVRERWGKQVYTVPLVDAVGITRWVAYVPDPAAGLFDWQQFDGADEVSALIAALEAAPKR